MAIQYILANSTGTGVRVDLGTTDDAFIAAGVTVGSTDNNSIFGSGSNHAVTVAGSVIGAPNGNPIELGDNTTLDSGQRLIVAATGLVSGDFLGAQLFGAGSAVANSGEIFGGNWGLLLQGQGVTTSRILNSGSIVSGQYAIFVLGSAAVALTNSGLISGSFSYFSLGTSIDTITNRGTMLGHIGLGDGADRYDGRGGTVEGTIFGDAGNDTFILGDAAEVIDGGANSDTIEFRTTQGAQVALDGSFDNDGAAALDTYSGIENIVGSTSADIFVGNDAANALSGRGGADNLSGLAGADRLTGGGGKDSLRGGLGDDVFIFERPGQGGDVILDFGATAGNNDSFEISAAGFGAGLVAGALAASQFRARADNVAQDADDRFIFRTGDKTLWFDADGNGAGGAVMIADLQASAVLTAADIFMV